MSDHGGQLPGPEFLAAAVPALLFLWMWWHWWRFARLLKDVPHTPVLGIFVGLVETAGTVRRDDAPRATLSGIPSVHYSWSVREHWRRTETYRDSKGRTRTRVRHGSDVVASGDATMDFVLADETGSIVVRSKGASWTPRTTFSEQVSRGHPLYDTHAPGRVVSGSTGVRTFTEVAVPVGSKAWVMANARPSSGGDTLELGAGGEEGIFMISLSGESSHLSGARAIAVVGLVLGTACAAAAGAGLARLVAGLAPGADGVAIAIAAVFGLAAWTAVVGAIWVGIVRNGAVRVRTRWERAASLVDVQLKRRADLIPNLVAVTKGTAAHESSVQRAVAELRAGAASQGILRILAEAYPSLTADQAFLSLQRQLADTESRIAESRKFEIESRKALLERLSTFPEGAVARVMGVAMPPPSLAEPAPPPSSRAHPPRG